MQEDERRGSLRLLWQRHFARGDNKQHSHPHCHHCHHCHRNQHEKHHKSCHNPHNDDDGDRVDGEQDKEVQLGQRVQGDGRGR